MKSFRKKLLLMMSLVMLFTSIPVSNIYASSHTVTREQDDSWTLNGDMWGTGTIFYIF